MLSPGRSPSIVTITWGIVTRSELEFFAARTVAESNPRAIPLRAEVGRFLLFDSSRNENPPPVAPIDGSGITAPRARGAPVASNCGVR